jgi:hypothetical protein
LKNFTYHIGKIRPRCHSAVDPCSCWEDGSPEKAKTTHDAEKVKPYPQRNLMNADSIGIEVVRWAKAITGGTGDNAFEYLPNYHAQNYALTWLIKSLRLTLKKPQLEVGRHPCIGWGKQRTEAKSADWDWNFNKMEGKYVPAGRPLFSSPARSSSLPVKKRKGTSKSKPKKL